MKLLRNPVIVGVLALVAVVYGVIQLRPLFLRGGSASPSPAPASAVATPAHSTATSTIVDATRAAPEPSIDLAAVEAQSGRWTSRSRKDPFQMQWRSNAPQVVAGPWTPPANELLQLGAIWRQPKGDLAVVNGRVVTVGDKMLEFKLVEIQPERIWVDGPNGREQVSLGGTAPKPTPASNQPPASDEARRAKTSP